MIVEVLDLLEGEFKDNRPVTCRQLFYAMVTRGLVPKDGADNFTAMLAKARRARYIPMDWITDLGARSEVACHQDSVEDTILYAKSILHGDGYRLDRQAGQPCQYSFGPRPQG